jgi:hypothetical protein
MAKQAQTMSSFFKAKPVVALAPVVSRASPAGPSSTCCHKPRRRYLTGFPAPKVSNTSPVASDFYKAFKPVPRRANVEWAEIHRWVRPRRRSKGKEDGEKSHDEPEQDLERWGGKRASVVGAWKGPGSSRRKVSTKIS